MGSFENFNQGMANLRGGFQDLAAGKERAAKTEKDKAHAEGVKIIADKMLQGGFPQVPKADRPGMAALIIQGGSTVLGKVFDLVTKGNTPGPIKGFMLQAGMDMLHGRNSGDQDLYDQGMQKMTTAFNVLRDAKMAEKQGEKMANGKFTIGGESVERSGGGGKGKKGKAGGGEGNLATHNIIDPATGQMRTVAIDKGVFTDINRQLRTMGVGEQKETSKRMGVENTVKGALRGGASPGGLYKDFIHSQQTNLLNNLVDTAVKAGHGKYLDDSGTPAAPQGTNQGPIKMARDPVSGKLVQVK